MLLEGDGRAEPSHYGPRDDDKNKKILPVGWLHR